jgi:hypothetical protein
VSAFESQWAGWQPNMPSPLTDKTDKSPSVSFVSAPPRHIPPLDGERAPPKSPKALTDKTDKRSTPGTADCSPGRRAVLLQVAGDVPADWVQGVADLLAMPPHPDWPEAAWKALQDDALGFLKDWAAQAHALGWGGIDLFGVHAEAPHARLDGMGLVPLLSGRPILALTEDSAAIRAVASGTLTFRRRRAWPPGRCLIWTLGGPS